MSSKRVFFIMVCVVVLLSGLAAASVVVGNSMLQKQSTKLIDLKLQNRLLDEEQIALLQANKDIQKYGELEQITKAIVPQDKDQAKAVREIVSIAGQSGVNLEAISFPTSTLGQAAPKPTTTDNSEDSTTPKASTLPVTQVKAVDGIPGVFVMEITVKSDDNKPVSYRQFLDFLDRLEQNRRTAQVANIAIQPNNQGKDALTFNVALNLYIKP